MVRRRTRSRPADPLEIARRRAAERERARDPQTWGLDAAALTLPVNADLETRADLTGRLTRAWRADVFDLLAKRGRLSAEALHALRRLQDDIARLHRACGGGGDYTPRVDRSRDPAAFAEDRLRAGARIDAALGLAGPASAALLAALCESEAALGRTVDWRDVVARLSGERLADAQSAILRAACENLAGAYALIDRGRKPPA